MAMENLIEEPMIQLDIPNGKLIAQVICKEIEDSFKKNANYYKLAKRCENQVNQVTIWQDLGQVPDEPWYGAADYFVPLTEWIVDAVHARTMNILFSQEPYLEAKGVESGDIPKEEGVTDFVDVIFREVVNLRENSNFFFKQMIKLPMAILKYPWVQDFEPSIIKDSAHKFTNPATGQSEHVLPDDIDADTKTAFFIANGWADEGQEEVWVRDDREIYNAPQLQYIRSADYVFSPNAKRGNRLYWEGDRFWMTFNEMKNKVNEKKFIRENVDKIRTSMGLNQTGIAEQVIHDRGVLRECFHWYGRLPFNSNNEIDFKDMESVEQEVHAIVDYKAQETLAVYFWEYKRLPHPDRVYLKGLFEETEEYWGRSLPQKLYQTQKYLNQFYNSTMNNAMLTMQKIFVKKRGLQGEEWENPEVFPGAMWEEDNAGDIRVLEMGDLKMISKDVEQSLINFAERISNISIYQTGTARTEGGQKTKSEVERTVAEGNIGLDSFIQRCHAILKTLAQWTVSYYNERMPPGMERRIRGDSEETIFPTEQNMAIFSQRGINPTWEGSDLEGKFDFKWQGTSLNSSQEWNLYVADSMMDRYLEKPMVAGSLIATWEILRRGLKARKVKDWQTILPPRDAVLREMESMKQKQQRDDKQRTLTRIKDTRTIMGGDRQGMDMPGILGGPGNGAVN